MYDHIYKHNVYSDIHQDILLCANGIDPTFYDMSDIEKMYSYLAMTVSVLIPKFISTKKKGMSVLCMNIYSIL